jgi:hypothetical protein
MKKDAGLTLVEGIIALAVLTLLAVVFFSSSCVLLTSRLRKGQMEQMLSNMKQLHYATLAAILDGTGNIEPKWPGNIGGTFSNWATLVVPDYMGTNDFCKMLSGPGLAVPNTKLPTSNRNAVLIYAVREESGSNTVLFTSANFTNTVAGGLPPAKDSRPFSTHGLVVFHKGGTGEILKPSSAGKPEKIGTFAPLCE